MKGTGFRSFSSFHSSWAGQEQASSTSWKSSRQLGWRRIRIVTALKTPWVSIPNIYRNKLLEILNLENLPRLSASESLEIRLCCSSLSMFRWRTKYKFYVFEIPSKFSLTRLLTLIQLDVVWPVILTTVSSKAVNQCHGSATQC